MLSKGLKQLGKGAKKLLAKPLEKAVKGVIASNPIGAGLMTIYKAGASNAPPPPPPTPTPYYPPPPTMRPPVFDPLAYQPMMNDWTSYIGVGMPVGPGGFTSEMIQVRNALEANGYDPDTGLAPGQSRASAGLSLVTTMPNMGGMYQANLLTDFGSAIGNTFRNLTTRPATPPPPPGGGINQAGMGGAIKKAAKYLPGVAAAEWIWDELKGMWVKKKKHRRMNVLNPRALKRADRRVTGFAAAAKPILHELGYHVSATRHKHLPKKSFPAGRRSKK